MRRDIHFCACILHTSLVQVPLESRMSRGYIRSRRGRDDKFWLQRHQFLHEVYSGAHHSIQMAHFQQWMRFPPLTDPMSEMSKSVRHHVLKDIL